MLTDVQADDRQTDLQTDAEIKKQEICRVNRLCN